MKKKLSLCVMIVVVCLLSIAPAFAKETAIKNMTIQVKLDEQGNAYVQEVWNMSVYEGTEVYKVLDNMEESVVSNLKVRDDKGNVYQYMDEWDVDLSREKKTGKCGIVQDEDRYELCFGIGEYGVRTYTFEYRISHFVKQYEKNQGFNYAFFSDISLDIDHVKVIMTSPYSFDETNSQLWAFGYNGKVYYDDGNVVLETTEALGEDAKMQLLMRIDDAVFQDNFEQKGDFEKIVNKAIKGSQYEENEYRQDGYYQAFEYKSYDALIFGIIGIVVVAGIGIIIVAVAYSSASEKLSRYRFSDNVEFDEDDVSVSRDIPCDRDLFMIYYLARKGNIISDDDNGGLIAAILLQWIQKGWLELQKEEEKGFFSSKEGFSIDFSQTVPCVHPLEKQLLEFFVKASGKNKILETGEFEKWCEKHYEDLNKWFKSVKKTVKKDLKNQGLIQKEEVQRKWLVLTIEKQRNVFDYRLRQDMEKIAGLKRYLEENGLKEEKSHLDIHQWEEYLIYANVLGVHDEAQEQIKDFYPYYDDYAMSNTFYTMSMVHMFTNKSYHASQSAQSSSSFSGGGSSFSGGGGGGVR